MDQNKLGLFSLLLKNTYEETIHIDVVKVKRDKMLMRLDILRDACKLKEYDKANFVLHDICDKILNDPYSDEYNVKPVEIDMVVFSSAVMSITVQCYDRVKQIITGLIMKYRNPIFYYVLGISYFYGLSFQDAKKQFTCVIHLLSEHKNVKFPWPDTDIMIITVSADKIKEHALYFLNLISTIQKAKKAINHSNKRDTLETIEITKSIHNSPINFNMGIGKCIQHEIYPHIQILLADLIKFDKSKLPAGYQKIISNICEQGNNEPPHEASSKQKQASVNASTNPEKNTAKKKESVEAEAKQKKVSVSEPSNPEKMITKKHQAVQIQVTTKCKQVQTGGKTVSQAVQTVEDNSELTEKYRLITEQQEIISGLKSKITQMTQRQKEIETKLKSYTKNDSEADSKNKLIAEQKEIITNLKMKLSQSAAKQKETEIRMNKTNNKVSELSRMNKTVVAESEKQKETIAELRNYIQILEKKAKSNFKKQEEIKLVQENLFESYKNSYFVQIKFYENFQRRCESVLSVLNNINEYLTEITVPTKEDCEIAIKEWFSAMLSSNDILQSSKAHYKNLDKMNMDSLLNDLLNMPPVMPIKEPDDILLQNVPILIYTIRDFESMLQNNHRARQDNTKDVRKEHGEAAKNGFNGKTDYRKKCNFIHKTEQCSASNENLCATFGRSSSNEATSDSKNKSCFAIDNSPHRNIDMSSKKLRSLISYLKQNIPHKSEADIVDALNLFRQNNNGTLSGMTLQTILYNVLTILDTPETAWSIVKPSCEDLDNEELCPICIEPIGSKPKSVLTCRHSYHTECIREWFSLNRVCAVCRMYSVLDEDFPPLKNSV